MMYAPLKMQPCYKEYLWGGTRLKSEFGKTDAPDVTAESWELASHPDGASRVAEGEFAGKTVSELGTLDRAGFWGSDCRRSDFPLLVKLIDAKKDCQRQPENVDFRRNRMSFFGGQRRGVYSPYTQLHLPA